MLDEIGEDAAVGSMDGCRVERPASKPGGRVDDAEHVEVMVAGDDNRIWRVMGLIFGEQT